jgi:hypothetical protein
MPENFTSGAVVQLAFLRGSFYLGFSFLMDLFGLLVLIGVLMAAYRRYIQKPDRLTYKGTPDTTPEDGIVLLLIGGIIVTGFIIEALRIHATLDPLTGYATWEGWSFVGWTLANNLSSMDIESGKPRTNGLVDTYLYRSRLYRLHSLFQTAAYHHDSGQSFLCYPETDRICGTDS